MAKMKFKGTINGRTYSDEVVFQCALQKAINSGEPVNAHIESVEEADRPEVNLALFDTSTIFTDSERLNKDEFDTAADKAFKEYNEWLGLHIENETFENSELKEAVISEGNRINNLISNLKLQQDSSNSETYKIEQKLKYIATEINRLRGDQTSLESKTKELAVAREVNDSRIRALSKLLDVYSEAVTTLRDTASGPRKEDPKPDMKFKADVPKTGNAVVDDFMKWLQEF